MILQERTHRIRFTYPTVGLLGVCTLAACSPAPTPQAQAARNHEMSCLGGSIGGALVGAAVGGLFGKGLGQDIIRSAGSSVGATEGRRLACGS